MPVKIIVVTAFHSENAARTEHMRGRSRSQRRRPPRRHLLRRRQSGGEKPHRRPPLHPFRFEGTPCGFPGKRASDRPLRRTRGGNLCGRLRLFLLGYRFSPGLRGFRIRRCCGFHLASGRPHLRYRIARESLYRPVGRNDRSRPTFGQSLPNLRYQRRRGFGECRRRLVPQRFVII